ncbi:MAG: DeoR/GlpR transcriptional regulator [Blautia sp.]|nr:DeoR/GlpR transcriptional regulator [Blautia sp.]
MELLSQQAPIGVKELAEQMCVSVSTVRKDLTYLENRHYLKVSKGIVSINTNLVIARELITNPRGKRRIAREAASLVSEGNTVFLSAGPCCIYLAEELLSRNIPLTLVTDSIYLCSTVDTNASGVDVYITGGRFVPTSVSTTCTPQTHFPDIHIDVAFAEISGYQTGKGFSGLYAEEKCLLSELSSRSGSLVALADSSNTASDSPSISLSPEEVSIAITDKRPSEFMQADLREHHIKLVLV